MRLPITITLLLLASMASAITKPACLLAWSTLGRRGHSPREIAQIRSMKSLAIFQVEIRFQELKKNPSFNIVSDQFVIGHARDLVRQTLGKGEAELAFDAAIADIDAKGGHAKALALAIKQTP